MAIDKAIDSTQLNADLTSVANAIRTKGGTSAQLIFPNGFVGAIGDIQTGGGGAEEMSGEIVIASDTTSVSFLHGLSQPPTIVTFYTPDPTVEGSNSPTNFRSLTAAVMAFIINDANVINAKGYNSSGTKQNLTTTTVSIDSTTVAVTAQSTAYPFKAGKTYTWRAIV